MIAANELRRNNIVLDKQSDRFLPVTHIRESEIRLHWYPDWVQEGDFEGIPLTPDLLEKAGFVKSYIVNNVVSLPNGGKGDVDGCQAYAGVPYDIVTRGEQYFLIIDRNDDDYCTNFTYKEVKYLHQLQNLYFALTDTELEINL